MASQAHAGSPVLLKNGLNANNLSLPDMNFHFAHAAAMAVAQSMDNFVLAVGLFFAHQILLFRMRRAPRSPCFKPVGSCPPLLTASVFSIETGPWFPVRVYLPMMRFGINSEI
jgi:hypothetical protein